MNVLNCKFFFFLGWSFGWQDKVKATIPSPNPLASDSLVIYAWMLRLIYTAFALPFNALIMLSIFIEVRAYQ